jgi:hypothetical protein
MLSEPEGPHDAPARDALLHGGIRRDVQVVVEADERVVETW